MFVYKQSARYFYGRRLTKKSLRKELIQVVHHVIHIHMYIRIALANQSFFPKDSKVYVFKFYFSFFKSNSYIFLKILYL